jgi:hypothetical protein
MMRTAFLLVLLVLASGCTTSPAPGDSGIEGKVMLGPTCPVQRDPPDPQCADKPYQANLAAMQDGKVVQQFSSDSNGTFHVALAPGDYEIQSAQSGHPTCSSQGTIHVTAGQFTKADVSCDTGIR